MEIELLDPSKRRPLRYRVNGDVFVAFTRHAVQRCIERQIAPMSLLRRLSGHPMSQWRQFGVAAKYRKSTKSVTIITCWEVE